MRTSPAMTSSSRPWVGVAFRHAMPELRRDQVISFLTRGPFVHAEIMLMDGRGSVRAYSAFDGISGFTPSHPYRNVGPPRAAPTQWTTLAYPLIPDGGYEKAYALILQVLSLSLPYNTGDLWQCCFQAALPFEQDLDCSQPRNWTTRGVFCSQVALLLLRRFARDGLIAFPDITIAARVEATNSRGCSPNQLFRLLTAPIPRAPDKKKNCGVVQYALTKKRE
jgi:hypothetical protein